MTVTQAEISTREGYRASPLSRLPEKGERKKKRIKNLSEDTFELRTKNLNVGQKVEIFSK